jgi:DNA-directed RNA polymerase specialized sigma24 family protein
VERLHLRFETTRWSLVRSLDDEESPGARQALATLCEIYWYPLYAYVRRCGHSPEDAQDLTQSFFAQLLERDDLRGLRSDGGRLRSYLLGALRHYLLNQAVRGRALKRGAGEPLLTLDLLISGEVRYSAEAIGRTLPPDLSYEQQWARALVDRALSAVAVKWDAAKKRPPFLMINDCLMGQFPEGGYQSIALETGMTTGAVGVAVHRLRAMFRNELRAAVADTVVSEADVEGELRWLIQCLGSSL